MDEHLSESHTGSVDALEEPPTMDLLAELMGDWDEPEVVAAPVLLAAEAEPEPLLEAAPAPPVLLADAVLAEQAAPVLDTEPEAAAETAAEPDDFLAALLAEQTPEAPSSTDLTNLAVTVDALTETTSPDLGDMLAAALAEHGLPEGVENTDVLDSLISDLARSAEAPATASDAPATGAAGAAENAEKYVLFSLAGTRFAVAIHQVIETDRLPQITRVPQVPDFVRGVINLRGDILSLIDLRTLWGLPSLEAGKAGRLLVVRSNGEQVVTGLVVDDVNGIAPITPDSLTARDGERNEKIAPLLRGVYEHQDQSLHVIDLEKLFLSPEIQQLAAN